MLVISRMPCHNYLLLLSCSQIVLFKIKSAFLRSVHLQMSFTLNKRNQNRVLLRQVIKNFIVTPVNCLFLIKFLFQMVFLISCIKCLFLCPVMTFLQVYVEICWKVVLLLSFVCWTHQLSHKLYNTDKFFKQWSNSM